MIIDMKKVKWTSLDQRVHVSFVQNTPEGSDDAVDPFTIVVSPSGVSFKGVLMGELENQGDLQEFAKLMGEVWKERLRLRVNVVTTPSGH